jgi:molybdopterin biosynthesis enzyme
VAEALARIPAKTKKAERHVPAFDISALDGFACMAPAADSRSGVRWSLGRASFPAQGR